MLLFLLFSLLTNLFGSEPILLPAPVTYLSCEQLKTITPKTIMSEVTSSLQVQRECGGEVTFNDWTFSSTTGPGDFIKYRANVKLCEFYSPLEDTYYFYDYYFTPQSNAPLVSYPVEYDIPPTLQAINPLMDIAGVISYPIMDNPKYKKKTAKNGVEVFHHSAFEQASRQGGDSFEATFRVEFNPLSSTMKVSGKAWDFNYPSPVNYEVKCPPDFGSSNKLGETATSGVDSVSNSNADDKRTTPENLRPGPTTQQN